MRFPANSQHCLRVVTAFNVGDVEYLIAGGMAVSHYCPQREARDMDLLLNRTHENAKRIQEALRNVWLPDRPAFLSLGPCGLEQLTSSCP